MSSISLPAESAPFRNPGAQRPELLAPAGNEECLRAAVGAGADAVYFGLTAGFNARQRTGNFELDDLPRIFDYLHDHGVKGYVAFNTVVYDQELERAAACLAAVAAAGADALIVQDLGVARFAHALAPTLRLHASTQMTVSSPEGAQVARSLGVRRIVLPRELSIEEMARFRRETELELECFVHGALCVSWSGQCLTSEAWGQRSANRGQCAQSCRLPYTLMVDGAPRETGLERYLLSPKDLGAWDLLPELCEAGISCFKIEGRYKGPDYVAAAVEKYRRALDGWLESGRRGLTATDIEELQLTYSRGFSPGWMRGDDHQELSHGVHPGHRGLRVGTVARVAGLRVWVRRDEDAPEVKAGHWIVFDQGDPEAEAPCGGTFAAEAPVGDLQELRFGDPGPDLRKVRPGDVVWKSHDSALKRRLLRAMEAERKVALDLVVRGAPGAPLEVEAEDLWGRTARVVSDMPLEAARQAPLGPEQLRDKLGALGETRYELRRLRVELAGAVAVAPSELKRLRRRLVEQLESQPVEHRRHAVELVSPAAVVPPVVLDLPVAAPGLVPLCRTLEQVETVLELGFDEVYLDFMELVGLGEAVRRCRSAGARVVIATMRVQKPGEEPFDKRFESLRPDGILARHLGALHHYRGRGEALALHGDFSLNATNVLTGRTLMALGLTTLTPSYDLNVTQLERMADGLPSERLEVTLHQHLPLYHTEYCVYAHNLSQGRNWRDCGRPCESHRAALRDDKGLEHPVLVDVGCRNTVFNARAQSAAAHVAALQRRGVRRFRIEFVWEGPDEVRRVVASYRALLEGTRTAQQVAREVGALERYGVTSGTFAVL